MIDIHSITGDIEAKMKLYGMPADISHVWRYRECVGIIVPTARTQHGILLLSFPPHLLNESLKQRIEDLGGSSDELSIGEGYSSVTITTCRDTYGLDQYESLPIEASTESFIDAILETE